MTWILLPIGILFAGALVDYFMPSAVTQRKTTNKWYNNLSVGRRS